MEVRVTFHQPSCIFHRRSLQQRVARNGALSFHAPLRGDRAQMVERRSHVYNRAFRLFLPRLPYGHPRLYLLGRRIRHVGCGGGTAFRHSVKDNKLFHISDRIRNLGLTPLTHSQQAKPGTSRYLALACHLSSLKASLYGPPPSHRPVPSPPPASNPSAAGLL